MLKKRISKTIVLTCGLITSIALLVGNTFATALVKDEADPFSVRIIPNIVSYTVKFYDTDNTTVLKTETVQSGHAIESAPSNPSLSNYVFDGWTANISDDSKNTYYAGVDIEEEVYSDLDLYPRMAAYGYNDGTSHSLLGNTRTDKTISTTSIKVGTYYNGSTKLFDASDVTLQYSGTYSFVCGNSGSAWTRAGASSLANWNIDRKISFTPQTAWPSSSYRYAVYSYSTNSDQVWNDLTGSSPYTAYVPYNHTTYIFCAMDKSNAANNWDNKKHQSLDITSIANSAFNVNAKAPEDNWTIDASGNTLRKHTIQNVPAWTFDDGYYPTIWVWGDGQTSKAFTISEDRPDSNTNFDIYVDVNYTGYLLYRRYGATGDSGDNSMDNGHTKHNQLSDASFTSNSYTYDVSGQW